MHAFDVLGDPVRRRILELLASGEMTAGEIVDAVGEEFAISQPAVSQHLKVLRESGFASRRAQGTSRLYALEPTPLREVDEWIDPFRRFWTPRLDALSTEIARGKRQRRNTGPRCRRRQPHRLKGEVMTTPSDPNRPSAPLTPAEAEIIAAQAEAVERELSIDIDGGSQHTVQSIGQTYPTTVADLWEACTDPA